MRRPLTIISRTIIALVMLFGTMVGLVAVGTWFEPLPQGSCVLHQQTEARIVCREETARHNATWANQSLEYGIPLVGLPIALYEETSPC